MYSTGGALDGGEEEVQAHTAKARSGHSSPHCLLIVHLYTFVVSHGGTPHAIYQATVTRVYNTVYAVAVMRTASHGARCEST